MRKLSVAVALAVFAGAWAASAAGVDTSEQLSQLMKSADHARRQMHDPTRAIALYMQAESLVGGAPVMHEQIADIYEYDLNDYAAAAKTLRALRSSTWDQWTSRRLDAEIQFLEKGQKFTGEVSADSAQAFGQMIFEGAGLQTMNGEPLDPALSAYSDSTALPPELKKKLFALPPSHTMFLRTWMFAALLTDRDEANRWLDQNDKAGFWRASLLALAALGDRLPPGEMTSAFAALSHTADGKPTGFALLAAKTKR